VVTLLCHDSLLSQEIMYDVAYNGPKIEGGDGQTTFSGKK